MKICIAAGGRFHIFDAARELKRRGLLTFLITNYPKFKTREFAIEDSYVVSILFYGFLHRLWLKINFEPLLKWVHNGFSAASAKKISKDCDLFWGLSSFCLEGIVRANKLGITTLVDHGSFHLRFANKIMQEESNKYGIKTNSIASEWIIQKEEEEFSQADFILVGSQFAKKTFIAQGYSKDKIIVNNYGVDVEDFKPALKNDTVFRIIFTGNVGLAKGIGYLVKAFNELALKNSELWIIGQILPEFDAVSTNMGLTYNNVFFKGTYPQKELASLYVQGSLFCLPSLADGFGMVVPQALACGLPVIVSENTGAKDIVADGINGFIVPICSVESLKKKILFLYENENLMQEMSKNAVASVKNNLSWNDYGNRLEQIVDLISTTKRKICP